MNQAGFPLVTILIFLPLAGAGVSILLGRRRTAAKVWTLAVAAADLVLAGAVWGLFSYESGGMQLVDHVDWIAPLGISYSVGVDGISLWLVLLTALASLIAVFVSWTGTASSTSSCARLLLALETGVLGVFCAIDLILFFIFWEAMIIPAYLLIGRWGGRSEPTPRSSSRSLPSREARRC